MTAGRGLARFRARYGAGPLHLLMSLAGFAIAAAAVVGWFQRPRDVTTVLEWFVAAIVLHDLVVLPLYSLLDRIAFGSPGTRDTGAARCAGARRPVNSTPYVRVPAILSGLLLAVFLPVIFGLGAQTELSATGIPERGYLARWLLLTGVMFAVSGFAYVVALIRAAAPAAAGDVEPAPADEGEEASVKPPRAEKVEPPRAEKVEPPQVPDQPEPPGPRTD